MCRRGRLDEQRGAALLSVLLTLTFLLLIGMAALGTSSIELQVAGNEKTSARALYIAEAGVQRTMALLRARPGDWSRLLAGPDGVKQTENTFSVDDGLLSFGRDVSFGGGVYDVRILDNEDGDGDPWTDSDGKIRILSSGAHEKSIKRVEVLFSLNPIPIPEPPAALSLYGPTPMVSFHGTGGK